ncbi:uncharacterized protein LOC121395440 isoform X3 [Xenopus laevis]|uniref:Uncharacterized protein LOC121395440 isoform X3 n=1 Tax=Xenopus laevis TaxID=8355 RepID=A0A8J1L8J5_XENLA|nr:uncharacterized protein LOC121395440 isoform X3 [Xenopus laevis]
MSQTNTVEQQGLTYAYSEEEAARIIGLDTGNSGFLSIPGNRNLQRLLDKEKRRLVGLELHSTTLTEYYRVKRIPRGLRVNLRPTIFTDNVDFKQKYEQILNKCSFDILLLNIEFLQREIPAAKQRVTDIERELKALTPIEEYKKLLTQIDSNLAEHRRDIEERKRSKFQRDSEDYRAGQVYRWTEGESSPRTSESRDVITQRQFNSQQPQHRQYQRGRGQYRRPKCWGTRPLNYSSEELSGGESSTEAFLGEGPQDHRGTREEGAKGINVPRSSQAQRQQPGRTARQQPKRYQHL